MRPKQTAKSLTGRLDAAGVGRALVSPLESVLEPDPMPGNLELLRATHDHPVLAPVPIINLRLTRWRDDLEQVSVDTRVRAVRLVPAWHGYPAAGRLVRELAGELHQRTLRLVVTARLEDERQQHFALRIRGLRTQMLDTLLRQVAPLPVLLTGLYHREILEFARHDNFLADISMAEWDQTMRVLLEKVPAARLCFGTLTPFLSVPANVAKLMQSRIPRASLLAIACRNLDRFLSPR